jgi:hypothetical protein
MMLAAQQCSRLGITKQLTLNGLTMKWRKSIGYSRGNSLHNTLSDPELFDIPASEH